MKKKFISCVLVLAMIPAMFIGCTKQDQSQNDQLAKEIQSLKEDNSKKEQELNDIKQQYNSLKEKESTSTGNQQNAAVQNIMPIFTVNVDTLKKDIAYYIEIPKDKALKDKLNIIAENLSKFQFKNLPIEVTKIEESNGKKIAVVNLKEASYNEGIKDRDKLKGDTWANDFFQGSTGGTITSTTLIENFLQKDFNGEWVDGVRFTYNGGNVEFQHVESLAKVVYRKK